MLLLLLLQCVTHWHKSTLITIVYNGHTTVSVCCFALSHFLDALFIEMCLICYCVSHVQSQIIFQNNIFNNSVHAHVFMPISFTYCLEFSSDHCYFLQPDCYCSLLYCAINIFLFEVCAVFTLWVSNMAHDSLHTYRKTEKIGILLYSLMAGEDASCISVKIVRSKRFHYSSK